MRVSILGLAVLGVVFVAVAFARTSASDRERVQVATGPLVTAIDDPENFQGVDGPVAFAHARAAGATFVRLPLSWDQVAPDGQQMPAGFSPRDPGAIGYRWQSFDAEVREAIAHGLTPIVNIVGAPDWAQSAPERRRKYDGPYQPSPSALADFATAAVKRYGGGYSDLPRVRYWQVWNEPNLSSYLVPLEDGGHLSSPSWYASMVNAVADAVHAVHSDNVVIAGALAPFGVNESSYQGIAPLEFMRALLCMSRGLNPKPTCQTRVTFDVWAHHPYTYGGPTHHASLPDNVSIGDLGKMRTLLEAAARAGHINARGNVRFWVTEFSWDTKPPDPKGVPVQLHARWVAEALYRMWDDGVSLVTWFLIRDEQFDPANPYARPFQSGLYYRSPTGIADDEQKLSLQAFRFPFVAFRKPGRRAFVWGRTPPGTTHNVMIQQSSGAGWRTVTELEADRYGIFSGEVSSAAPNGHLRARLRDGRDVSVPFGLRQLPDRKASPFGF